MLRLLVLLICMNFSYAQDMPFENDLKEFQKEKPDLYKKEKRIINKHLNKLSLISKKINDATSKEMIENELSTLLNLQKTTKSPLLGFIIVNSVIKKLNIKEKRVAEIYLNEMSQVLIKYKICDGYLFQGEYLDQQLKRKFEALEVYRIGLNYCKNNEWKKFTILSRYNKLNYNLSK